mmetsp:Transcript_20109/g.63249  ORF Transcript_20109/g.63249 Transcript_20109/m.63249 type:complete len:284 (+) Transcript_20109:355-1206(+)
MRAAAAPDGVDAANASNAPAAASACFWAAAFFAALMGPDMSAASASRARIFSCCGMTDPSTSDFNCLCAVSTAATAAGVSSDIASSIAKRSLTSRATACAAAARSRVHATNRRTPLAMPCSSSNANPTASFVLRRCVPPHSSTDKPFHRAETGADLMSETAPPTATTRTGSGYASPFIARSASTAMASSSGVSLQSTTKAASMTSAQSFSAAASSSALNGLSQAMSNLSRSSSTCEPRCAQRSTPVFSASTFAPSRPPSNTSRSAKFNTCVMVWFGATRVRRS